MATAFNYNDLFGGGFSNVRTGSSLPSNFQGPVRPNQNIGGVNPLAQKGQVLGATTQTPRQYTRQSEWDAYNARQGQNSVGGAPARSNVNVPSNMQASNVDTGGFDLSAEIDNLYNPAFDYLNQAEQAVRADQPNALAAAEAEFNAGKSRADTSKNQSLNQIQTQQDQGTQRKDSALAAARQLYDELGRGARQRFGGSSSAGQAASEIQGREMQRQFGDINTNYSQFSQQLGMKRQEVEDNYQSNLMQLEQSKQQAMQNVTRDFQNKLLEISNNRAQIGQAKAQARLDALLNLRNQIFAIQQQNMQFQQTLALQKAQANESLTAYEQQLLGVNQGGAQALGNFSSNVNTNPTAQSTIGNSNQMTASPALAGYANPYRKDLYASN